MSRDYEAGYRDGSIHYELEHCSACKNVADLQEALAENARLRGERDMYRYLVGCMVQLGIPYQSADENAKLRELVELHDANRVVRGERAGARAHE